MHMVQASLTSPHHLGGGSAASYDPILPGGMEKSCLVEEFSFPTLLAHPHRISTSSQISTTLNIPKPSFSNNLIEGLLAVPIRAMR